MRHGDAHGPVWNDDKFHIYATVVPELRSLSADRSLNADCIVDLTLTRFVFKAYLEACRRLIAPASSRRAIYSYVLRDASKKDPV